MTAVWSTNQQAELRSFRLSELPMFGKQTQRLLPAHFSLAASSLTKLELPP